MKIGDSRILQQSIDLRLSAGFLLPMSCCRCNRSGKCRSCVCAKSGKRCTNCLPIRLSNCQNHTDQGQEEDNTDDHSDSVVSALVNDHGEIPQVDEHSQLQRLTSQPSVESIPQPEIAGESILNLNNSLPPYTSVNDSNFQWGGLIGAEVDQELSKVYEEVVHWRRNLFKIPSGRHGKAFVQEMASLFQSYADASAREKIALKATMVLPALLLQKPFKTSKVKDHISCIERRHSLWRQGKFQALLDEGRAIQQRLQPNMQ